MTAAAIGNAVAIAGALVAAVAVRSAVGGASAVGALAFVAVLGAAVAASGWRPRVGAELGARSLSWGLAGAGALTAGPLLRHWSAPALAPPVPGPGSGFASWAVVVVAVVVAEEALLRGALWQACQRVAGGAGALAVTTAAFAVMHVPLYGWRAVPLDVLVGLALGALRMVSGSVTAPAVAHLVADWAGWWLA